MSAPKCFLPLSFKSTSLVICCPFKSHLSADFASPSPVPLNLLSNLQMLNLHLTYQEHL